MIAVLTRNEHCPPHVHVGCDQWDARFEFSFWHQGVRLWDVVPARNQPTAALLEQLRLLIMRPAHLRKAREVWWIAMHSVCLMNQRWDTKTGEVVMPSGEQRNAPMILAAYFDARTYTTALTLAGQAESVEIEL